MSKKQGFEMCDYLLIGRLTEALKGKGQRAVTVREMIGQLGLHHLVSLVT